MNAKEIEFIIEEFEKKIIYKKILIKGKWGIGKSYYINNCIKDKKHYICISLFGKTSIKEIEKEIVDKILENSGQIEKIFQKGKRKFLEYFKGGSISIHGITLSIPQITQKRLIQQYGEKLNDGNIIIIMDDLERKSNKISIKDILGLVEELSLLEKIRIILIGDDTHIQDNEDWKEFKEKVIEKEYLIDQYSEDAILKIVKKKSEKYIEKEKIQEITEFLNQHKITNLRTIEKGMRLFEEILSNLKSKNKELNFWILKTSLAVAIEKTGNLYSPKEKYRDSEDMTERIEYINDENLVTRIERHYFNSSFGLIKETVLIEPIFNIFIGNYSESTYTYLKNIIYNYLEKRDKSKNIFYGSIEKITSTIKDKYNSMLNDTYNYTSIEQLIDDTYNILVWNKNLTIGINENNIEEIAKKELFKYYFNVNTELKDILIDEFDIDTKELPELKNILIEYNKEAMEKYFEFMFKSFEAEYKNKTFNLGKIRWIEDNFIQLDREELFKRFEEIAQQNDYFIPDMSSEIEEKEWNWIHYIWYLIYEYLTNTKKQEIYNWLKTNKITNQLSQYRFNLLMKNKPLVKDDGDK